MKWYEYRNMETKETIQRSIGGESMSQKTMKVLDIHNGPISFCCIKHLDATSNPYWLYSREWRDGAWHKRLIIKYQDFRSVIWFLNNGSIHGDWQ